MKQWQIYKALELIPDSVPEPASNSHWLGEAVQPAWRSMVNRWAEETSKAQQIEHLKQCWLLSLQSANSGETPRSPLGAALGLLWRSLTRDPEIEGSNPYIYARAWDWMVDGQPAVKKQSSIPNK